MEQPSLTTPRLRVIALSLGELRAIDRKREDLLPLFIIPSAFLKSSLSAIAQKIHKMAKIPTSLHPWYTYWLIVLADESKGIGFVGFKGKPDASGFVEVGYSLSPEYRRNGYMKEALSALIGWAKQDSSCRGVTATRVLKDNIGSNMVLLSCNFVPTFSSRTENNYVLPFLRL